MPRISIAAVLLLAVGVMFAPNADAALTGTFDFVAEAAGNERGVPNGTTFSNGGVTVQLDGTNGVPYLDDVSGGPGGLGVCTVLDSNDQCDPSNDDNISMDELITLTFSGLNAATFIITNISFNDALHTQDFGGELGLLDVDGNGYNPFSPDTGAGALGASGFAFTFQAPSGFNGTEQLYISSITVESIDGPGEEVPEPGTIGLMLIGLGMLAGGRKFRNRKNS